ncbi:glycosyltransferase family 4 protein [Georgenia yuyongxinii]|uniref:Glycosyltransferase family 4 protein n=1 Tax=Georgenia yuyongxinii TaxID=2589797 RepID=A0A5B8C4T4_9MICO|nr:glycosyltransferase [Georgenia yuyongxinii]QDC25593.1 glycosyltransferase family 4 protein [Georgenia yuyongxinii]
MRVLAFGTYDVAKHPRVQVLIDGLRDSGVTVDELNHPLDLTTAQRVQMLRQPWRLPVLAARLASLWGRLTVGALRLRSRTRRTGRRPDAVLVGYLGHFDVLLARVLFPRRTIVLDHLVFAADTAVDRGAGHGLRTRLLGRLDRLAIAAASLVVLDTDEHRELMPEAERRKAVVVPVGATGVWFAAARDGATSSPDAAGPAAAAPPSELAAGVQLRPLSVVFFGLFTPLQGAPVIGRALRLLHQRGVEVRATLIGSGQDVAAVHRDVDGLPEVTWHTWVDGSQLPAVVAQHDVSLGIFGTTPKALRVVPNKVYQGAAAGAAVVTSDTAPQRRALGDAAAYVPAGDAEALADTLAAFAGDPARLAELRRRAAVVAAERFTPQAVVRPLVAALER